MAKRVFSIKVVLLGEGGVGKTSLRKVYLGEGFKQSYQMTIGADFAAKRIKISDSLTVTANIWDLAGQTRFQQMRTSYYNGVGGALLVFDISRPITFERLQIWLDELKSQNDGKLVPIIVIGNKSDLRESSDDKANFVSQDEAKAFSESLQTVDTGDIQYIATSALTGDHVEEAFETLIKHLVKVYKWN
ncbi:MAG: Rab family GTPase [Candidatus Kariarchaeaceae archaeon]